MNFFDTRGKVAISVIFFGLLVAVTFLTVEFFANNSIQDATFALAQSTATTTVTILNTPPNWVEYPFTSPLSTTSSPTNAGNNVTWLAIGTSPNANNYYLLLCKTSSSPTANSGAAPTCAGGGGNQWAVSGSTTSSATSTAIYTTSNGDAQINVWFGWICDGNLANPRCNGAFEQGTSTQGGSPFVVNHRPTFSSFANNSPAIPGAVVTWVTSSTDPDNFTGATDTVELYVCKANDFTGTACGPSGTFCSTTSTASNPSCTSTIPIPTQDQGYSSYGFIIDQHFFAASGGSQSTNSTETVSAVAPTIASASINLLNVGGIAAPLALTNPGGQTSNFQVTFTATDNNSCLNAQGGQEVATATINVFRSGIGAASCLASSTYNPNNCYPAKVGTTTWNFSCSQNGGACSGSSSITAAWTCTFPLWYVADPTDGSATTTQFSNQSWTATVQATNWVSGTSTNTQGGTNSVTSFLASQLNTQAISFGSLSPGSTTPTLAASTSLSELGNVGLNETLYGVDMCTTYNTAFPTSTCPVSATSTIPVGSINYASSNVSFASGFALASNPGNLFSLQILKSTSTATSSLGSTFWGLSVPATIQLSGGYTGENTFIAVRSSPAGW